jgi:hypothetical protein
MEHDQKVFLALYETGLSKGTKGRHMRQCPGQLKRTGRQAACGGRIHARAFGAYTRLTAVACLEIFPDIIAQFFEQVAHETS